MTQGLQKQLAKSTLPSDEPKVRIRRIRVQQILLHTIGCVALAFVAQLTMALGPEARETAPIPTPHQPIQIYIKSLLSPNEDEMFSGTEKELQQNLIQLRKLAGSDTGLVLQLFYSSAQARGMREAMLPMAIVEELKIPNATIATAILPLLETKDDAMRKEATQWLAGTDAGPKQEGVDFRRYEKILRKEQPSAPLGLIRYMFDRNPESALLVAARVYGDKDEEAVIAAKLKHDAMLKSDAKTERTRITTKLKQGTISEEVADSALDVIAAKLRHDLRETWGYFLNRPEWWAHLYVAELMRTQPELRDFKRDAEILERLDRDDHFLMREALAKIKSG